MIILQALMGFSLLSGAMAVVPALTSVPVLPAHTVTLTAYNAVPAQTDSNPLETASGAYSNPQIIAARSRDLADMLPFGTIIEITGPASDPNDTCGYHIVEPIIGYRVIEDTMNVKFTDRIDVLVDTKANYIMADGTVKNAANVLGLCDGIGIRVVGHVDINHLPKTQAALAAIVTGSNGLAIK